jgi:Zn-dependent protease
LCGISSFLERLIVRNIFSTPDEDIFAGGRSDMFELVKAWAGTSLAFAIFFMGGQVLNSFFLIALAIAALTCGIGFLLHELAHRVVARRFGAEAHFVADDRWLLISIGVAFLSFFIAAPGAVWHRGLLTPRQSGLIALAGPVTNLALALLFWLGLVVLPSDLWIINGSVSGVDLIMRVGYNINAWLGLFNLIPAGPFDGAKVLAWDWRVLAVTAAVAVVLVFVVQI